MSDPDKEPFEIQVEPTVAGRIARWTERARIVRAGVEAARADHTTVDFGFKLVERDSSIGAGLLCVNVFNVYITTRLVEDRANTYGALGIAAALLLSLVLVGRVIVVAAELNAALDEHRRASSR